MPNFEYKHLSHHFKFTSQQSKMNDTPASGERVQKYVFNFEIYRLAKKSGQITPSSPMPMTDPRDVLRGGAYRIKGIMKRHQAIYAGDAEPCSTMNQHLLALAIHLPVALLISGPPQPVQSSLVPVSGSGLGTAAGRGGSSPQPGQRRPVPLSRAAASGPTRFPSLPPLQSSRSLSRPPVDQSRAGQGGVVVER